MRRWIFVSAVALTILVANVIGRTFTPAGSDAQTAELQTVLGVVATSAMALISMAAGVWWSIKSPLQDAVADLGLGLLGGTILAVFAGPLLAGLNPLDFGFGMIVAQILIFFVILAAAAYAGYLIAMSLGLDSGTRSLRQAEKRFGRKR